MSQQPSFRQGSESPVYLQQLSISQGEQSSDSRGTVATSTPVQQPRDSARPDYKVSGTDVKTFKELQATVVPIINHWAQTQEARSNTFHQVWLTSWKSRIYVSTTFSVVKRYLRIKNLKQYHDHIRQCPAIVQNLETEYDSTDQRIRYRPKQVAANETMTSVTTNPPVTTTAEVNTPPNIQEVYEQVPQELEDIPRTVPDAVVSRLHSQPEAPTTLQPTQPSHDEIQDEVLAELIMDIEEEDAAAPGHRFRNRFLHRFIDTYNAKMGDFGNYIKSTQQHLTERIQNITGSLDSFDAQLTAFDHQYHTTIENANKEVQEMDAKISYFNTILDQRIDTAVSRVSQQVTHYQLQLTKWTKEHYEKFQKEIQVDICNAVQTSIDSQLAPLFDQQTEALEQHGESLLTAIETQAAEGDTKLEARIKQFWNDVDKNATSTNVERNASTRWKHVTMPQNTVTPQMASHHSHSPRNRWGQNNMTGNAKTTGEDDHVEDSQYPAAPFQHFIPRKVPSQPPPQTEKRNIYVPLHHYEFVKRAQVKYAGQAYVFYNKLRNIGQQYGVYLKALNTLKCGLSLCPDEYAGHYFTTEEYRLMAAALYEKLADTGCISEDYPAIRHIIDGYTEDNDGYQIMYEIMEEHHPALQSDPVYRAPTSLECDNKLQEYTARFQAYMTAETLNHRYYQPKEQVLHYLAGLDEDFSAAVQYVQTLLDSWGSATGLPPKCDLRVLPKTIDDFMKKHATQISPVIRTAAAVSATTLQVQPVDAIAKMLEKHMDATTNIVRSLQNNPTKSTAEKSPSDKRQSVDIFCDACGGHGHKAKNCDFAARLLKSLDYIATLDVAKKKEIMATFIKEQTRRRLAKITDRKGRARALRDTGDVEGLYKLVSNPDSDDDSDSQQSTES
jgi:hypothetical protein